MTLVLNRRDETDVLKQLIPLYRESIASFYDLTMRFSPGGPKDYFVRCWQQLSRSFAEIENKIRERGTFNGLDVETMPVPVTEEKEPSDTFVLDRTLILRCLNHLTELFQMYGQVRHSTLSFDIQMILQRHHLQILDTMEHLAHLEKTYPYRPESPVPNPVPETTERQRLPLAV